MTVRPAATAAAADDFSKRPVGEERRKGKDPKLGLEFSDEEYWRADPQDAFGGMGLYASPRDFFAVLLDLLATTTPFTTTTSSNTSTTTPPAGVGKLLSPSSVREFFSPQLSSAARDSLAAFLSDRRNSGMGGFFLYGSRRDHSLAGMLLAEELSPQQQQECPRRKGAVAWKGLPNFYWGSLFLFREFFEDVVSFRSLYVLPMGRGIL